MRKPSLRQLIFLLPFWTTVGLIIDKQGWPLVNFVAGVLLLWLIISQLLPDFISSFSKAKK